MINIWLGALSNETYYIKSSLYSLFSVNINTHTHNDNSSNSNLVTFHTIIHYYYR